MKMPPVFLIWSFNIGMIFLINIMGISIYNWRKLLQKVFKVCSLMIYLVLFLIMIRISSKVSHHKQNKKYFTIKNIRNFILLIKIYLKSLLIL